MFRLFSLQLKIQIAVLCLSTFDEKCFVSVDFSARQHLIWHVAEECLRFFRNVNQIWRTRALHLIRKSDIIGPHIEFDSFYANNAAHHIAFLNKYFGCGRRRRNEQVNDFVSGEFEQRQNDYVTLKNIAHQYGYRLSF